MFDLLVLAIIGWLAWRYKRAAASSVHRRAANSLRPHEVDSVRCCACGLHLPREDAVRNRAGMYFCCREHERSGCDDSA